MMAILKCIQCLQREENVPMELQKQVIDYYEYFWKAKKGVHLTDVYNDMTLLLKAKKYFTLPTRNSYKRLNIYVW